MGMFAQTAGTSRNNMQGMWEYLLASSGKGVPGPMVINPPECMLALEFQSGRCLILDWAC